MKTANTLILIAAFLLASCKQTEAPKTPLARVDNETLTLEYVQSMLDSDSTPSHAQLQEYTQRWIVNELLYREAIRRSIDNSEELKSRVESARRQLVVNALLDDVINRSTSVESASENVAAYYNTHKNEFSLPTDVALLSFALFRDREAANTFRTKVLRGTSWNDALEQLQNNPQQAPSLVARIDSSYFTSSTLFPPELWRVASASQRTEPSFAIRTDDGFYCLIVWKFLRQGQLADIEYVEKEIRGRLAIDHRRQAVDSLLENLRARHVVEVFISSLPPDGARTKE